MKIKTKTLKATMTTKLFKLLSKVDIRQDLNSVQRSFKKKLLKETKKVNLMQDQEESV